MAGKDMKNCTVKFIHEKREATVAVGSTIMDAANKAGVYIGSICGGVVVCGKCRVTVQNGSVNMKPNSFLNDDEIKNGVVIACMTEVLSDLTVEVPEETRLEGKPKSGDEHLPISTSPETGADIYSHGPLCSKVYLELPQPSLTDNLSDLDRVMLAISRIRNTPLTIGLDTLRTLAPVLRDAGFNATVTLAEKDPAAEMIQFEAGDTTGSNFGIAVDVGTTTVIANMIDLNSGTVCGTASCYNSQIRFGEDVISRIVYSQENKNGIEELNSAISGDINNLALTLIVQCGTPLHDVNYLVCAGNTTMIHILLGLPLSSIRREPYIPVAGKPPVIRASEAGITIGNRGLLKCLPGVGAYVGSDITAGVLASGMARSEELSLLIDIGTNGEIVLGNNDFLICCSASAGPAFEGAGTQCGMRATDGAIEKVKIRDNGAIQYETVGDNVDPLGICGSGFIDLVAELFCAGIIDRTGRFQEDNGDVRLRDGSEGTEFILITKERSGADRDIVISEADIATFIRTKGSVFTAAEALLHHIGFSWKDVDRIYISGGFGNSIDIKRSIIIGLLPDVPAERFHFIGNGSIFGARMCLVSGEALKETEKIAENMTYFDLSTDLWFMNEYSSSLFLPHTDLEKFPTVSAPEADCRR